MQAFEYASPTTLAEAFALLGSGDAQVLAGGTDQISLMKDYIHTPKRVVNIKGIREMGGVARVHEGLRIGATVIFDELVNSAVVRSEYPSIHAAAAGVTSPQIRNVGTAGGDLCQRPRCWYFRNGFGLLATNDGKSLVPGGENKYHAIFGGGPAYFVSASSLGPALIALNAKVGIRSARGSRSVPVEKFFVIPKDEQSREIDLKPDEILTEILIPGATGVKNATYEVRQREALDWPLVTASVALRLEGANVREARIVLGHVAPVPWVAEEAAKALIGQPLNAASAEKAGAAAVAGAQPLSQNGYKIQLAKVAVKRALLAAAGKEA
ncbi:MAG: FAD binding domain-containing protein [Bryobacteraceae bacterium]|jgi:xanthine dehydrogenase YagS FAD-binding subunit